jgi:hypothetical protein
MSFQELVSIVEEYAAQYNCPIWDAIDDLEFDGPGGSYGPSFEDKARLQEHFA